MKSHPIFAVTCRSAAAPDAACEDDAYYSEIWPLTLPEAEQLCAGQKDGLRQLMCTGVRTITTGYQYMLAGAQAWDCSWRNNNGKINIKAETGIYVIKSGIHYKIGMSYQLTDRIRTLLATVPGSQLIGILECPPDRPTARRSNKAAEYPERLQTAPDGHMIYKPTLCDIERYMHHRFSARQFNNEWYDLQHQDLLDIFLRCRRLSAKQLDAVFHLRDFIGVTRFGAYSTSALLTKVSFCCHQAYTFEVVKDYQNKDYFVQAVCGGCGPYYCASKHFDTRAQALAALPGIEACAPVTAPDDLVKYAMGMAIAEDMTRAAKAG